MGAKTKGWIKNNDTGISKSFMYNPEVFEYSRSASYSDIVSPGKPYPGTQYVSGGIRSFSVELFLHDMPCSGKIKDFETFLFGLLPPESNSVGNFKKPPSFVFCLGSFVKTCVLESLSTKIELFDSNLEPTMARFTLQVRQVEM